MIDVQVTLRFQNAHDKSQALEQLKSAIPQLWREFDGHEPEIKLIEQ